MAARRDVFTTIRSEGALLPPDFLQRVADGDKDIPGLTPDAYHLAEREKLSEAITRSWKRLLGFWAAFQGAAASLRPEDASTGLTREKWLLPLFQELGYGRLPAGKGYEIEGKSYPISHAWQNAPIHLLGRNVDLDRPTKGVAGAARHSPHGLVQEFLNRHEGHLWGFLSNGLKLRVLRDNKSLTRQAYVEFDLAGMMDGQVYSDFVLLWLLCHQSRVEAERAEQCWLEKWADTARTRGTRALDRLRHGVKEAIQALGRGFLAHPANRELLERLRTGALDKQDYYRQLLRTVYRLIFLFVAEDRDLLLTAPHGTRERERYLGHYSAQRLRSLSERRRGSPHADLWRGLNLVFAKLSSDAGCPELGLPALGSFLWSGKATPDIDRCELANTDLLAAVRSLAFTLDGKVRRAIDYRNLGAEELGSVYESLLELHPVLNASAPTFELKEAPGHERKTTGSYYTPTSLIECLLDSALEPVLQEALKQADPEKAILGLKVCDPACGSGHFLIAAAHRMANRLAAVRTGDEEPSPEAVRKALRNIVGRCLYGVDINPMAVELCKVNLWLEALEPGKPLSFLEHHIQCGNALLGATPALMARGIPDEAFTPIEGDDDDIARSLRNQNKAERTGQATLFSQFAAAPAGTSLVSSAAVIESESDEDIAAVRRKAETWERLMRSPAFQDAWFQADTWCSAFVWPKDSSELGRGAVTHGGWLRIQRDASDTPQITQLAIRDLARRFTFFHWHLAFPQVFGTKETLTDDDVTGWAGGFHVVLGNPPWDTLSPDAKEFFSQYNPDIRFQDRDRQAALIDQLLTNPSLSARWEAHRRELYASVHFMKDSGRYLLFAPGNLGKGDFNVYRMFIETALRTIREGGRVSQIVPEGLYNGANCMAIRKELFEGSKLDGFWGFENNRQVWFDGIDGRSKFTIYSAQRPGKTANFTIAFNIRSTEELAAAKAGRVLRMPVHLVETFSPEALAVMEFGSQRDIDIAAKMYDRYPKFGDEAAGPPYREYMREIDMGNDRDLFTEDPSGVPLYEGRMVAQYDHRAKGYRSGRGRKADWDDLPFSEPTKSIQPQWYIPVDRIPDKVRGRNQKYRIGFCDVTSPTNERSLVAALIPPNTICGDKVPTIVFDDALHAHPAWLAIANSFAMDFLVRKKVSLKMSYTTMDSLPFPRFALPGAVEQLRYLLPRVLRLVCTGVEMSALWNTMAAAGWVPRHTSVSTVPGSTDEAERRHFQAEIDAYVAREVYGLTRDEIDYVLGTFPIVEKRDRKQFGHYRTKRLVLEEFDALAAPGNTPTERVSN